LPIGNTAFEDVTPRQLTDVARLLVEQMGLEPTTSALRIRLPAKT
jgi:hypothetical protein